MWEPYPKIISLHPRDEKTHKFIEDEYRTPEFEYLKDNEWLWSEKVDGTSMRVEWLTKAVGSQEYCIRAAEDGLHFKGRTDNAQIPSKLYDALVKMFPEKIFEEHFPNCPICLYGEGYGEGIQKGGKYLPHMSFVLFDVMIDDWWLKREDVEDVADKLGLFSALKTAVTPIVGAGTLQKAEELVKSRSLKSTWGDFEAEGLVLRPEVELCTRGGKRIITKLKGKDFA